MAAGDANKPVFDKYFGNIRTADFAIAGDTTQGVLWGLRNGEGQGFQPKAVMLMIGTNNTGAFTAPEIAEGVGAVVMELRRDFPDAKILLLAIFPRSVPGDPVRDKIAEVNRIVAKLDDQQHVFYLDIGRKFLDDKGVFLADSFRPDNLHPQAKGYDIWGEAVSAKLAELMATRLKTLFFVPPGQERAAVRPREGGVRRPAVHSERRSSSHRSGSGSCLRRPRPRHPTLSSARIVRRMVCRPW